MKDPVIVTGGPRSGTTLTMRFLHAGGLVVGPSAQASPLMEGRIRDELYKPILIKAGFDPRAQLDLPPVGWKPSMETEKLKEAVIYLSETKPDENTVWGFKAIKGLLFWRALHEAFPNAKWIIVHRKREDHIDSLMRTRFMNSRTTREGWNEYLDEIDLHLRDLQKTVDWKIIKPSRLRKPEDIDTTYFTHLFEWIGLEYTPAALSVFNHNLYKTH